MNLPIINVNECKEQNKRIYSYRIVEWQIKVYEKVNLQFGSLWILSICLIEETKNTIVKNF